MTGNNMGQLLNGSRTIFALAENGDLPRWFAQVHPDYRTPSNAILFGAGVALIARADRIVRGAGRRQRDRAAGDVSGRVHVDAGAAQARSRDRRAGRRALYAIRCSDVAPPQFTVPFGPVIPVLASIVALGILAGATQRSNLIAGAAALAGRRRAVLPRAEDAMQ